MRYWIYKINPAIYKIDERLPPVPCVPGKADVDVAADARGMRYIAWTVGTYVDEELCGDGVKKGDVVFMWRTAKHTTDRKMLGAIRVSSAPKILTPLEHEKEFTSFPGPENRWKGEICKIRTIPAASLKNRLSDLSVFNRELFTRRTLWPVTDAQGKMLLKLLG